jgi:hypothetical protein
LSYAQLFRSFVEFYRQRPSHPFTVFCEDSIRKLENASYSNEGALLHIILHSHREDFDELLKQFVKTQDFWSDPLARFFFEVDLINRPYIYRNTQIVAKRHLFANLRVINVMENGYVVEIPTEYLKYLGDHLSYPLKKDEAVKRFELNHRRSQLPFMRSKPLNEHFLYCHDMSLRMSALLPVWREMAPTSVQSPGAGSGG